MTIIISSTQADIATGDGLSSLLREFGDSTGIPDLFNSPAGTTLRGGNPALNSLQDAVGGILNSLYGNNSEIFDNSFTGSGRHIIAGGGSIAGGKVSPLEDASIIQTTNQTPVLSVLIKKRAFSSLNKLYDPTLMDDDELWLFRATKRLFARKCAEIADYERLSKIKKLVESSTSSIQALAGLMSGLAADASDASGDDSQVGFFTSMRKLEKVIQDRKPTDTTTWFYDSDVPFEPKMGSGSGVFEITLVASLNTSLSIDGSGTCSFSLDNPYNILRITEHDIEMALRDTALSKLVNVLDKAAGLALSNAQTADAQLNKARKARKRSSISFTVSVSGQGTSGTMDAIGMTITPDNLDLVPEPHSLDSNEKNLVKSILSNLEAYSMSTRRNLLDGLSVSGGNDTKLYDSMSYSRRMMRKFYMGKLIIQPMDTIHIFIDGSSRRSGEATNIDPGQGDIVGSIGKSLGLQETWQIDDPLLMAAWEISGQWLNFEDFKKLFSIEGGTGIHVFGGLVSEATGSYSADTGRYEVSVSANSNMEWLRLSRYNKQPALQQTEGVIWDPLTPFKFEVDQATGLPTGRATLSDTNQRLISSGIFLHRGRQTGQRATERNLQQDIQVVGGTLTPIFEMPPGLKYRWKEGIVTMAYAASAVNPLDPTMANENQLRREIGQFTTNTAFDNIDVANVISLLVTGFPHNTATFIESALFGGRFQTDTTLNSTTDYFHSFLDVQKSINLVQGNFSPFKRINADRHDLAQAIATQQRLSSKSSRLKQIKNQYAQVSDQLTNLQASFAKVDQKNSAPDPQYTRSRSILLPKKSQLETEMKLAENEFNELLQQSSTWRIAGDDIGFDLTNPSDTDEAKLFGDRLLFASQRRREDVIYNRDKNYLIVSEEYDKDFDIQAFALKMREQQYDNWRNTYENVYALCRQAAEALDLEFICNTQGHLELRPPQYNKTPLTVLNAMLSLNNSTGVKLFPPFLEKLVSGRVETLVRDIVETEYEMMRQSALLGATDFEEAKQTIFAGSLQNSGSNSASFLVESGDSADAIAKNQAISESEKRKLQGLVSNGIVQASRGTGIFSVSAQSNLVRSATASVLDADNALQSANFYDFTVKELVKLTGKPLRSYPSFDEAKVGVNKNGQSTPVSDVAAITDRIAEQVSRRSKLLRVLEKVLEQSIEIASVNSSGQIETGQGWSNLSTKPSELFEKMVEDDSQDVLGHMSGKRFIIGDESLFSYRMSERPPNMTVCSVSGSADALTGVQQGFFNGSLPAAKAFGADFDLWRQYGFRQDINFDKPYFYDSELQCAPYAKMLLTRQHKEILSAEAEVIGNEFYQLGDSIYLSDVQMMFYVQAIRHSFIYEGGFNTTLSLTYGHPVGDYIPTPLDIIGKSLSNTSNLLSGARIRRLPPSGDSVLGVVRFSKEATDLNGLMGGQDGQRNYGILQNVLLLARREIDFDKRDTSSRVVLIAFGDTSNEQSQKDRLSTVFDWLVRPTVPGEKSDNFGVGSITGGISSAAASAVAGAASAAISSNPSLSLLALKENVIMIERLAQLVKDVDLKETDKALLKAGVVADSQSWTLDETLDRVVEIRLRPAPVGGWPQ